MADKTREGGLSFGAMNYGTFNPTGDRSAINSGSRRRGTTKTYVDKMLRDAYARHALEDVYKFYGVVINSRMMKAATYTKRGPFMANLTKPKKESDANFANEHLYYVYKVYIPEMEPRPFPLDPNDPIIYTYADVYTDPELDETMGKNPFIPNGALVVVQYDDLHGLTNPTIVDFDGAVMINWQGMEGELASLWPTKKPTTVGGTRDFGERDPYDYAITYETSTQCARPTPTPVKSRLKFTYDELLAMKPALSELLSWISAGEGKANSINRGSSSDSPPDASAYIPGGKQLTSLTIAEVMSYQKGGSRAAQIPKYSEKPGKGTARVNGQPNYNDADMYQGAGLYAVGKIQYIPSTLKSTVKETQVDTSLLFTAEVQDNLALRLLIGNKQPILSGYLLGLHDNVMAAGQQMAAEWASIPAQYTNHKGCKRGYSYHCGKANTTRKTRKEPCEVVEALERARQSLKNSTTVQQLVAAKAAPWTQGRGA